MATNIFRVSDFEDLDHGVRVTNVTSNVMLEYPNKIRILELDKKVIVLRIPVRKCAEGHTLLIEIFPKKLVSGIKHLPELVNTTGKVLTLQNTSATECEVRVELVQFAANEWEKLLKLYDQRQDQIDKILAGSRG